VAKECKYNGTTIYDFKKAYDSDWREVLSNILIEFGITMKLVKPIIGLMCLNKTYSTVRTGKHLSDASLSQNSLKQGDAVSPLLSSFALE
jgi:hypothetical protein